MSHFGIETVVGRGGNKDSWRPQFTLKFLQDGESSTAVLGGAGKGCCSLSVLSIYGYFGDIVIPYKVKEIMFA